MKKKLFTFFMSSLVLIPTMLGLSGCGGKGEITYDDYEEIKTIASTIINSYDTLKNSEDVVTSKPEKNTFASSSTEFSPNDMLDMLNTSSSKTVCTNAKTWFDATTQSLFAMALAGGKIMADDYKDPNYYGTVLKAWEGSEPTPENPDAHIAYEYFQLKEVDEYNKTLLVYGPESNFYLKMSIYFRDKNDFKIEYLGYEPAASGDDFNLLTYMYSDSTRNLLELHYQNYDYQEMRFATWHNGIDTFQIEDGVLDTTVEECIDYLIENNNPRANYQEICSVGTSPKYTFHYDRMWEAFGYFMGDLMDNTENMDTGTPFTGMIQDGCLTGINYSYVKEDVLTLPTGIDSIVWGISIPNTIKKIIIPNNVKYIKIRQQEYDTALESYNDAQNNSVSIAKQSSRKEFIDSVGYQETYVKLPAELAPYISSPLFSVVGPDGNWLPGSEGAAFSNIEFSTTSSQTLFSYTEDQGGICITLNDWNEQPQTLCFALKDPVKLFKDALENVVFENNTCSLLDYCIKKVKETGTNILPSATMETQRKIADGEIDPATFVKTITFNLTTNGSSANFDMLKKTDPQTYETIRNVYTLEKVTINHTLPNPDAEWNNTTYIYFDNSVKTVNVFEINSNAKSISINGSMAYPFEIGALYLTDTNATKVRIADLKLKASNLDIPESVTEFYFVRFTSTNNLTINSQNIVSIIEKSTDPEWGSYTYEKIGYQLSYEPSVYQYETTAFTLTGFPTIGGTLTVNFGESLDLVTDRTYAWEQDFLVDYGSVEEAKEESAWIIYNILKRYPERMNVVAPLSAAIFDSTKVAEGEYKIGISSDTTSIDATDYFYNVYGSTYKLSATNDFTNPLTSTTLTLEYGDNVYYLELTSADGQETKVYKLNFYRKARYTATFTDRSGLIDELDDVAFDENKLTFTLPVGYILKTTSLRVVDPPVEDAIPAPTTSGNYKVTFEFDSNAAAEHYFLEFDISASETERKFFKFNTTTSEYEECYDPHSVAAHFRVEVYFNKYSDGETSFTFSDNTDYDKPIAVTNVLYYDCGGLLSLTDVYPNAVFSNEIDTETNRRIYTICGISEDVNLSIETEYQTYYLYATFFNQKLITEDWSDQDGNPYTHWEFSQVANNVLIATYTVNDKTITIPTSGLAGYIVTGGVYLTGIKDWTDQHYELSNKVTDGIIPVEGTYGLTIYVEGVEAKTWNIEYVLDGLTLDDFWEDYKTTINGPSYNLANIRLAEIKAEEGYDYMMSITPTFDDSDNTYHLDTNLDEIIEVYGYDADTIYVYAKKELEEYTLTINLSISSEDSYYYSYLSQTDFDAFDALIAQLESEGFVQASDYAYYYTKQFTVEDTITLPSLEAFSDVIAKDGYYYNGEYITSIAAGTTGNLTISVSGNIA